MSLITDDFLEAQKVLNTFIEDKSKLQSIEAAGKIMVDALKTGGKIISCGNGGSMSDAMHFAEELTGLFRENRHGIAAISISDPSHISCVANDYGYDYIFSRFIESMGNQGDVLLGIRHQRATSENGLDGARIGKREKKDGKVIWVLNRGKNRGGKGFGPEEIGEFGKFPKWGKDHFGGCKGPGIRNIPGGKFFPIKKNPFNTL